VRIRYSKAALCYAAHKPCHFEIEYFKTRFTRNGCAYQGASEEALNRAQADPDTWIECEREEEATA
jgi:hypothetical protein